jgi:hypothetical protein
MNANEKLIDNSLIKKVNLREFFESVIYWSLYCLSDEPAAGYRTSPHLLEAAASIWRKKRWAI